MGLCSLRSHFSPLKRGKNCSPFLGESVLLETAIGLVGNGILDQIRYTHYQHIKFIKGLIMKRFYTGS
jgi:hypothetical protein